MAPCTLADVEEGLEHGANKKFKGDDGNSALHLAALLQRPVLIVADGADAAVRCEQRHAVRLVRS